MKKLKLTAILLAFILLLPTSCFSTTYSLERLFNQPDMEQALEAQLEFYKINIDIGKVFDYRHICIQAIKEYLAGEQHKSDITLEAFRQFLCTNILLAAIFDKENTEIDKETIDNSAKSTILLYKKLNKARLIDGDVDKFMYMYNSALNYFAPRLIPRL